MCTHLLHAAVDADGRKVALVEQAVELVGTWHRLDKYDDLQQTTDGVKKGTPAKTHEPCSIEPATSHWGQNKGVDPSLTLGYKHATNYSSLMMRPLQRNVTSAFQAQTAHSSSQFSRMQHLSLPRLLLPC